MADEDFIRREAGRILLKTRGNARRRGIGVFVTKQDIADLLRSQKLLCAVSGIRFDSSPRVDGGRVRPFIPSLDRIDAKQPYCKSNVRLVCAAVNAALGDWGDETFLLIALGVCAMRGWTAKAPSRSLPVGVSCREHNGVARFEVNVSWDGRRWYLGGFSSAKEAGEHYQHVKRRLNRGDTIQQHLRPGSKGAGALRRRTPLQPISKTEMAGIAP